MKWIIQGGFATTLQLLITIVAVVVVIRQIPVLYGRKQKSDALIKNQNDLILYAGVLNVVVGLIGQLMGLFNAFGAIIVATEINKTVIAEGFRIASIPTVYGFWSLIVLSLFWITFRMKARTTES